MRKISAFLAILTAFSGALGFMTGPSWEAIVTSGAFAITLAVAGVLALRGADLIYLASAWGFYTGMNLAAYLEVIAALRNFTAGLADLFLSVLLLLGVVGLVLTLVANHRERLT